MKLDLEAGPGASIKALFMYDCLFNSGRDFLFRDCNDIFHMLYANDANE